MNKSKKVKGFFVPSDTKGVWRSYNHNDTLKRTAGTCKLMDKIDQPCIIQGKYGIKDIKRVTMTNGDMHGYIGNVKMFKECDTTIWRSVA